MCDHWLVSRIHILRSVLEASHSLHIHCLIFMKLFISSSIFGYHSNHPANPFMADLRDVWRATVHEQSSYKSLGLILCPHTWCYYWMAVDPSLARMFVCPHLPWEEIHTRRSVWLGHILNHFRFLHLFIWTKRCTPVIILFAVPSRLARCHLLNQLEETVTDNH